MLFGEMGGILRQPKNEQCSKPLFVDVASWLVSRFAIVPCFSKLFWAHALFGRFAIVPRNLGRQILFEQNVWVKKKLTFFLEKSCLSAVPKRIRPFLKPLLKNSFSTNFQGTGSWEGPIHFSTFVLRVHNCSTFFQSWSWSQEKKEKPFTKAACSFSFFRFLFLFIFSFLFLLLFLFFSLCSSSSVPLSLCSSSFVPLPLFLFLCSSSSVPLPLFLFLCSSSSVPLFLFLCSSSSLSLSFSFSLFLFLSFPFSVSFSFSFYYYTFH